MMSSILQKRLQCTGRIHNAEGAFYRQVTALLFTENVSDNIETLKKACTYGADAACLIGFERFDFSETEQLSQIMAETIRTYFLDYDLILFGRLAYDGDAVNVSTQVSCHLGIPRVVYSQEIYTKDQVLYARKYISSSKEAVYATFSGSSCRNGRTSVRFTADRLHCFKR